MPNPSQVDLVHGQTYRIFELVLALNHPVVDIRTVPETFVLRARKIRMVNGAPYETLRELAQAPASMATDVRGAGVVLLRARLAPDETSLWLGYRPGSNSKLEIPIHTHIPFGVEILAWRPDSGDRDNRDSARAEGWVDVLSPFQAPGKWQWATPSAKRGTTPSCSCGDARFPDTLRCTAM